MLLWRGINATRDDANKQHRAASILFKSDAAFRQTHQNEQEQLYPPANVHSELHLDIHFHSISASAIMYALMKFAAGRGSMALPKPRKRPTRLGTPLANKQIPGSMRLIFPSAQMIH